MTNMSENKTHTLVRVSKATHDWLVQQGRMNESMDQLLRRLLRIEGDDELSFEGELGELASDDELNANIAAAKAKVQELTRSVEVVTGELNKVARKIEHNDTLLKKSPTAATFTRLTQEQAKLRAEQTAYEAEAARLDLSLVNAKKGVDEATRRKSDINEKRRKLEIADYLTRVRRPRCKSCRRREKMEVARDSFGRPLRKPYRVIEIEAGSYEAGLADARVAWALRFGCAFADCPLAPSGFGQLVRPDAERFFDDGERDDEFPCVLKKDSDSKGAEAK